MSNGEPTADLLERALEVARAPIETACTLLENLLGEPCKVAGGMLADQVYAWQWKNRIRIANRAQEIMKDNGIAARVLPPGFLLPLLEGAGYAEDPDLQELWANLLTAGVADDSSQHPLHIDILRRMDGNDARVLRRLSAYAFPLKAILAPPEPGDSRSVARFVALGLLDTGYTDPDELFGPTHIFMSTLGFQVAEALGLEVARVVLPTGEDSDGN